MHEKAWIGMCFFISLIGALLQIAAYVTPMWLWIVKGDFYLGIGLWFVVGCGDNCTAAQDSDPVFSTESNSYYSNAVFNVLRGFETACLIGAILLCIFLLILFIGWSTWNNMAQLRTSAIIMSFITWLCLLFGLGIYIGGYHDIIYYSPRLFDSESFPWSAILSILALICILLVTIFLLCCTTSPKPLIGIPISGDSKMALTPTMTDFQNGKKYYVPSPYTDDRRIAGLNDEKPAIHNGIGYNNKAYITDYEDRNYNPTSYRPRSYAEPSRIQDDISYRSAPQPNFQSLDRYREPKYLESNEPVYSHYIERARPPAGGLSVLPPITSNPDRSKYTDQVRLGASTAFMYRPYAPERY
ncbi:hypothetical protein LOTGIDRAFT_235118 [Lottia gigantea]|uniref:Uncharacterized protein n=1 Tax=Lottia gigantea TaxID=225164 RepID=V3Z986_LOTGI|nr:hypothetical protein LOTGIDRAFT_235118 [Lottia gigantea]ESO87458.1 hypothetical protein LOTGIDRAFT_235118 [Lottia gigantea]